MPSVGVASGRESPLKSVTKKSVGFKPLTVRGFAVSNSGLQSVETVANACRHCRQKAS
jgi:hypothetical protein